MVRAETGHFMDLWTSPSNQYLLMQISCSLRTAIYGMACRYHCQQVPSVGWVQVQHEVSSVIQDHYFDTEIIARPNLNCFKFRSTSFQSQAADRT